MLISVIIPSFNRFDLIGKTITSVLSQKVDSEIEIVIGDDASTDGSRDVLLYYKAEYPDVIKLIFHEKNMGLGANWATCLKACHGEYICNCDNDDFWHNEKKLQLQIDYMQSHPQANVLFTDYITRDESHNKEHYCSSFIEEHDSNNLQSIIGGGGKWNLCNDTVMYRASFLFSHITPEDYISYRFTLQDWNTWVILSAYTDFDIIHEPTATVLYTTSISRPDSVQKLKDRFVKEEQCMRYLSELFPDSMAFDESEWLCQCNRCLFDKAFHVMDYKAARLYLNYSDSGIKKAIVSYKVLFNMYSTIRTLFL